MKKMIFSMALLASFGAFAQDGGEPTTEGTWTRGGNVSLVFNQAAFNHEWTGGGTNNVAVNLAVSYAFNYKKNDWTWDNNLYVDYGLTKLKGDEYTRKTTDRLEYNSLLGKQASNNWYYSAFLNFKTQFTDGYKYEKSGRTLINEFFSPAYLQFGPGMLWKKNDNLKVNLAPATSKLVMVNKDFTKSKDYYGVKKGESLRYELGFAANGYAKFNLMENVSMENILNLYSNYLDKPQNLDIDYTANVVMSINKYLSANLTFQAIYDDNAVGAFQIRELFGAGFNYKF